MYRDQFLNKQNGAGLPVAIFVITVLSLLVIGMAQLQESSGKSVSLQIQSQRAFLAAESGAQVLVAELLAESGDDPLTGPPMSEQLVFSGAPGLAGCTASLEYTVTFQAAKVISLGVCGGGTPEEARRIVEVRLR
ncbi:hypothetical protein [Marinobacter shengliensis]|uniref:hypothetical protein n=1 Tax=Marinobacter shengliensis TaxID=1389223 RepID=UPI0035B8FE7A